jgi:hypothetical protein
MTYFSTFLGPPCLRVWSLWLESVEKILEETYRQLIGLVALRDTTHFQVEAQDAMAPVLELVCLKIDATLLHSPDIMQSEGAQGVKFTKCYSRLGKEPEDLVLNLNGSGQWISIGITYLVIMERYQAIHQHVFGKQEIIKTEQS